MNITEIAVRRPVTILMIVLGLVVMGAISYGLLPVRELPNVRYPYLQVTVDDPGADPQDVRLSITDPMENALTTVNGVTSMTSVSMQGVSEITIQLASGISLGTAANDVAQALHSVARKLPSTASLPSITETNPATMPILNLSLSGKLNQTQLYTLAQNMIVPAIESVPGVGSVNVQGGLIPQVNVQVHESALLAYGVTLPQIRQALTAQNASVPSGAINNGSQTYTVSTNSPYTSLQSLGNVIIAAAAPRSGAAASGAAAGAGGAPASAAGTGAGVGAGAITPVASGGGTAGALPQTRSITLGQIARITQGYATPVTINRINGKTAIGLSIDAQSNADSLSVESGVLHVLQTLKKTLPPGAALNVIADTTVYTRAALSAVLRDLVLAVVLASAVLYLFLRRLSHTIIVLCAIPASLIATFTVMYAFGFSLDLMSMLALSLLIGILVDDSIVVLENIDRHLTLGADPKTAAIRGRMEIGAAAVAITLTDVVVYVPIVFVHGTIGQLFREFGVTIVAATLFSLFVSFTLTPMLASRWLRIKRSKDQSVSDHDLEIDASPPSKKALAAVARKRLLRFPAWRRLVSSLPGRYERLIRLALRRRLRVIAIGLSALALSACFIPFGWVGTAFVPQENPQVFRIDAQMPTGTSLQTTDATMRVFSAKVRRLPAIQAVFVTAGNSLAGITATNAAVLTVVRSDKGLTSSAGKPAKGKRKAHGKGNGRKAAGGNGGGGKKGRNKGLFPQNGISLSGYQSAPLPPLQPLLARVSAIAHTIPGLQIQTDVPNPLVVSGSEPISVIVSGPSTAVLQALAARVQSALTQVPSLTNIQNQTAANLPIWLIHVNNLAAAQLGVNALMVGQAAQTAIGGAVASTLQSPGGGVQTNIMVSLNHGSHLSPSQMTDIPIARRGTQMVTLGDVATVSLVPGPVSLNEANRQLTAVVTAGSTNPALGIVAQHVQAAVTSLSLPPGYSISLGGEIAQQTQAFGPLLQAFILSVALVYMLMAALYESLVMPLVVLFSLPMATVGAFLGLLITGQTLNIFSFMALIMLMGLVAKNAILLVDYTGQLVRRGMPRSEALVLAGKTRLRPIVMTTATMVFSMIPLALRTGIGSSDRIPIAVVLIGGLTTSTLLTLVVVPVLYTYMDDFRQWLLQFRRNHSAVPGPAPSATQGGSP